MAIYIKYADLNGVVSTKGYERWMEVQSMQWGVHRGIASSTGSDTKREASAPSVSEIVVTKTMDGISPLLLKEAIFGKACEVKIHLTQTDHGGKHVAYQKYILSGTMISSYSISSSGERPMESMSMSFSKFDSEYIKIDDKQKTETTGHVIYSIAEATTS
jgi:type VI secretion system secreted protein Hcp